MKFVVHTIVPRVHCIALSDGQSNPEGSVVHTNMPYIAREAIFDGQRFSPGYLSIIPQAF